MLWLHLPGSLAANASTFLILGSLENKLLALAINAEATLPDKYACLPFSSGKVSGYQRSRKSMSPSGLAGFSLTSGKPLRSVISFDDRNLGR